MPKLPAWRSVLWVSFDILDRCSHEKDKVILLTLGVSLLSHTIPGLVIYFLHWRHFWYTPGLAAAAVRLIDIGPQNVTEENIPLFRRRYDGKMA